MRWTSPSELESLQAGLEALRRALGGNPAPEVAAAVERLTAAVDDVTADAEAGAPKVQAIASLAAERDQLQTVLDRLGQGVLAVDRDLRVEVANAAASSIVGSPVAVGDVLPDPWAELSLHELALSALAERRQLDQEAPISGDRYMSATALPTGPRGRDVILVLTDLTERERAERVEREFVANASHELRTPLATIRGAVEILQSGAKEQPDARDRFLRHIEREVDRLSRLVGALLAIARAQARHELPDVAPVLVRPVLEQVASSLAVAPGVAVVVTCPPTVTVVAEPDLLLEIVANLAANAAKHTGRGRIALSAQAADGAVTIEVRDTGSGIDDAVQSMIFDRFYRGGARHAGGFGLGLAIVREAVNALGGGVELDSTLGEGTAVRVTLPAADPLAA